MPMQTRVTAPLMTPLTTLALTVMLDSNLGTFDARTASRYVTDTLDLVAHDLWSFDYIAAAADTSRTALERNQAGMWAATAACLQGAIEMNMLAFSFSGKRYESAAVVFQLYARRIVSSLGLDLEDTCLLYTSPSPRDS